jgi:uncharacterized membrane protein YdfJ with MMPL/SSD domain
VDQLIGRNRIPIVIRTLLVPALVALLDRWNWWMPSRLARLLRIATPTQPMGTAESTAG